MARGLASLGVEFSEEAVEPVTGYRVDMLLHGGDGGATGPCAVEVGIGIVSAFVVGHQDDDCQARILCLRCHCHKIGIFMHNDNNNDGVGYCAYCVCDCFSASVMVSRP